MASRQELLDSIRADMKLTKSLFLQIYGYELTRAGFAQEALTKLENAGCSKAGEYYTAVTSEYEAKQHVSIKPIAEWYRKKVEDDYDQKVKWYEKRGDEQWKSAIIHRNNSLMRQKDSLRERLNHLKALL